MKRLVLFLVMLFFLGSNISAVKFDPIPIGFSMPESKIVSTIPAKDRDFAFIIPGNTSTYIYQEEASYYKDYQRSYFALTTKKAGWDCLRHYEILANGCIPYFVDLDNCPENTMHLLPKTLIKEAMNLPGVSYLSIDHAKFDKEKYYEILAKLLDYIRTHLTTKAMAQYLLEQVNYRGSGKILFLSSESSPDYLRCLVLAGLKELLGDRVVDVPKIEHIYKSYPGDIRLLYGKGITYTKLVDDVFVDREDIENRVQRKEFDLVIYGSVHRGTPLYDFVYKGYESGKIVYLCGEDGHQCSCKHWLQNLFLREF